MFKKLVFAALLMTGVHVQCGILAEYNSWQTENRAAVKHSLIALKKHFAKFSATYTAGATSTLLLLAAYMCEPTYTPEELQIQNEFWNRPEIGEFAKEAKNSREWYRMILALAKGTPYEKIRNRTSTMLYAQIGLCCGGVLCLGYALGSALKSKADCQNPVSIDYTYTEEEYCIQ